MLPKNMVTGSPILFPLSKLLSSLTRVFVPGAYQSWVVDVLNRDLAGPLCLHFPCEDEPPVAACLETNLVLGRQMEHNQN